jgi:hypothetical protein
MLLEDLRVPQEHFVAQESTKRHKQIQRGARRRATILTACVAPKKHSSGSTASKSKLNMDMNVKIAFKALGHRIGVDPK